MTTANKQEEIKKEIQQYISEGYDQKTILSVIRAKHSDSLHNLKTLVESEFNRKFEEGKQPPKKESDFYKSSEYKKPEVRFKKYQANNQSKKTPGRILIILVTLALLTVGVVFLSKWIINDLKRGENMDVLELQIPLFTGFADSAIYDIRVGSARVKEGFQEYLDQVAKYSSYKSYTPDIDEVLDPYISSAERSWRAAQANIDAMYDSMKRLKPILKPSIYEKFADLYSAITEYKQGVSPYGKNANDYKKYTTDYEIKITREISKFKSYIGDYEDLLE